MLTRILAASEDKTTCTQLLQRVKMKDEHLRNYDLWALSIMENGVFVSTNYLQCDHDNCLDNPKSHFYRAGRLNPKGKTIYDKTITLRHEVRNHIGASGYRTHTLKKYAMISHHKKNHDPFYQVKQNKVGIVRKRFL